MNIDERWFSANVASLLVRTHCDVVDRHGAHAHASEGDVLVTMLRYTENAAVLATLRELGVTAERLDAWREAQRRIAPDEARGA